MTLVFVARRLSRLGKFLHEAFAPPVPDLIRLFSLLHPLPLPSTFFYFLLSLSPSLVRQQPPLLLETMSTKGMLIIPMSMFGSCTWEKRHPGETAPGRGTTF